MLGRDGFAGAELASVFVFFGSVRRCNRSRHRKHRRRKEGICQEVFGFVGLSWRFWRRLFGGTGFEFKFYFSVFVEDKKGVEGFASFLGDEAI